MTTLCIPQAKPAQTTIERRHDVRSPAPAPIHTLRRRLATRLRRAVRDRRPLMTVSEQVLSDIHNVHSLQR